MIIYQTRKEKKTNFLKESIAAYFDVSTPMISLTEFKRLFRFYDRFGWRAWGGR